MAGAESEYKPDVIEPKWQERWRELRVFESSMEPDRPKYYCYNPAPYVTGSLHMGHVRNYTCGDFVARFMRLHGAAVLYTIGFDAYGLPTEMAAIRHSLDPERWTADCLQEMKRQLGTLGCGFDWGRSFLTSDPEYYRWTQWIFLQLHERNLVYSATGSAYWCPQCESSLARAQVEDGGCWICASPVERRDVREWRLRISAYLGDLLKGLEEMRDLNGLADHGQRDLIGPRVGFCVDLQLGDRGRPIAAFMERKEDWLSPCALAVNSRDEVTLKFLQEFLPESPPESPPDGGVPWAASEVELLESVRAVFADGRLTGLSAIEPRCGRRLPIVIVTMVDPTFVDQPTVFSLGGNHRQAPSDFGAPPDFPSLIVYRQKDFSVSRQRLWGTPIPMVMCEACGEVPVSLDELPVLAPKVVFDPATRRLKREDADWDLRPCPRCARAARLDPQVMDCHMDSLWHPFRPCGGKAADFLFDPAEMRYWMPADIIQFGRDVIPFMLDLRFLSHFLHHLGHVPFREFCHEVLAHGLVLHEGRKMSKHLGNVVTPEEIIRRFGADSLRFYVLAHAEPRSDFRWSQEGIQRYHAILSSYYDLVQGFVRGDHNTGREMPAVPGFSKYTTVFLKKAAREASVLETSVGQGRYDRYAGALVRLFSAMDFFAANHRAKERHPRIEEVWRTMVEDSVLYLAPVAPHLAEECWELLGNRGSIFAGARFPAGRSAALEELTLTQRQERT